ncbi:MAG: adenylate/guanylate cyclase domain-containing protein, partial [Acidimicrobiia bacterium]
MAGPSLPSGLVTFLFTDIEGSTRLFHRLGEAYPEVLEQHRRLLRAVWEDHDGHELGTEGDSFLVAFDSADDAIRSAADAQRALASARWPEDVDLKVRMGVHSGFATPRGQSYISMAIHQASRVIETAHGGQIVVTQDTEFLAGHELSEKLRPLGRFRLRDFAQPVRLYQVVGEGLEAEFPALKATPADQHNIVPKPTETIGREPDIAAIASRVSERRTVTLTGPGGVGKSRVATDVGLRVAPDWEDGVWLVELAPVQEADLVPGAVAEAVGAEVDPAAARIDDVLHHLETRRAVVILDNCEHLTAAVNELLTRIHAGCERVAVVTTSREPLHLPGEIVWPVHPLPTPPVSDSPGVIAESASGRLFIERGQAVRPGFDVDDSNAAAVAAILRHLDGLPLLIELAAAHLSAQSPVEILRGLEESFNYLRSRDPMLSDRHRTVGGLMEWSYRLLSEEERAAFRRLSLFADDFTQQMASAAIAVGDIAIEEASELIWSLVDRSLIEPDFESEDTRYRLLETLRSYGQRLAESEGETSLVAVRLARVFMERLGPWMPADGSWVGDVDADIDNLRGLIPLIPESEQDLAQQIACTIGRYHDATQTFREGIEELSRLSRSLNRPSSTRVSLLTTLGDLYLRTGEVAAAAELVEMAAEMEGQYGHPEWDDVAVDRSRGEITRRRGDLAGAIDIARNSLERDLSDRGRARMYNLLGTTSG